MELQPAALKAFSSARTVFLKDLEALPDEAFTKAFGPKTRTVADIVTEVNMVNDHIGMAIRGEESFEWPDEGWIKAPEGFGTKGQVIEAFADSSGKIVTTIEGFSEADMEVTIETEHGPSTRYQRCQFMCLHLWYHSGQLNYIQTLLGDDQWHW